MTTFWERIRNLFSKKDSRQERGGDSRKTSEPNAPKNEFRRAPHPYEEVDVDEEGAEIKSHEPNNFQKAKPKQRQYDEVDIQPGGTDGAVTVRD